MFRTSLASSCLKRNLSLLECHRRENSSLDGNGKVSVRISSEKRTCLLSLSDDDDGKATMRSLPLSLLAPDSSDNMMNKYWDGLK